MEFVKTRSLLLVSISAMSFTATPVIAGQMAPVKQQDAVTAVSPTQDSAPVPVSNDPQLEDIIVQARRISERQQSVPIAISTVTDRRLAEAAASSIADIQRLVPSLQITQGATGQRDFTIRGSFGGFGVDPAVITYIDDVPIDSRSLVYSLFDLQSVQQLKGPQGTLFGRNSTGGAVLFFSKKPDSSSIGGYASARYGNYDERRLEGAINLPLTSTLAVRVSGQVERRDGLLQSVTVPGLQYDNRDNFALRGSVLWAPSDMIENYTQLTHYRVREHRYPQVAVSLAGPCTSPFTPAVACIYQAPFNGFFGTGDLGAAVTQQQALPGNRTVNNDPATDTVDRDSITNSLTVNLGPVSVRNISYYGRTKLGFTKDYDGTAVRVIDTISATATDTFYTETQLFGKLLNDRLNWRIGGVYSDDEGDQTQTTAIFALPVSLTNPKTTRSVTKFRSKALFGQASYDLSDLLRGVSVTGGYRYTWDNRKIATTAFSGQPVSNCALQTLPVPTAGPIAFPQTDLATCTRRLQANFADYNYNLTLDWKPTDKILVYVATRRGYKTGSFNTFETNPTLASYAPESVTDIELGLKADWKLGGMPVRTNVAVFRSKYTNIQSSTVVVDPASGDVNVVVLNRDTVTGLASKATIKGVEVELVAAPTSWLELSGFYSRIEARYDRFFAPSPRRDLTGENVDGVVPETYGITGQVRIPVSGPFDQVNVTASYYHAAAALRNVLTSTIPTDRSSFDARMGLRNLFGTGADLAMYGKNLANKISCSLNPLVSGELTQTCSEPRTYGVELTVRFGSERR